MSLENELYPKIQQIISKKIENLALQFFRPIEQWKNMGSIFQYVLYFIVYKTTIYSLSLLSLPYTCRFPHHQGKYTMKSSFQILALLYGSKIGSALNFSFFGVLSYFFQLIEFLKLIEKCFQGRVVMTPAPINVFSGAGGDVTRPY